MFSQGLKAQGAVFERPSDLIVWFKETQEAQAAAHVAAANAARQKAVRPSTTAGTSAGASVVAAPPAPTVSQSAAARGVEPIRRSRFHN